MPFYQMTSFVLTLIPLLLMMPACGPRIINWNDPQETASRIEVNYDQFKKITTITGPNCAPDPHDDELMLRAWKLESGRIEFQVYISDKYTYEIVRGGLGWRFYTQAHDNNGEQHPVVQISRTVNWCGRNTCSYLEVVGVTVTRDYLAAHSTNGIMLKISGKGGEQIISIPGPYIAAFLKKAV